MQRAGDPGTLERLRLAELLADRHEAGHFVLRQAELVATGFGQREVGDCELKAIDDLQFFGHEEGSSLSGGALASASRRPSVADPTDELGSVAAPLGRAFTA
ncbi:hypothetical protein Ate02nite_23590 [Paractinoplanes tereljensis]|uniref:Uncharacterized protein n=1 Tax=Paractinoplanes tereljensis TaxID=571912 RepID=A0A919NJ35_9ACTN|nr:hypothetical protein Ate02nite_23590 [Actinoplanes tereljensis]